MACSQKSDVLRKSSAPGSEAARDKWLVQKNNILRKNSAPGSEAARDKWLVKKKVILLNKSAASGSEAARDKWLVEKKVLSRKSSAPGSAAAPDKWLGRERANNRCSQGRGAPFWGVQGVQPPGKQRGAGGRSTPASHPPNLSQIYS